MADLSFAQQFWVSATTGIGSAISVGVAGWAYFRWQERVRWHEGTQGGLAKLRQQAIVAAAEALGRQVDARMEEVSLERGWEHNEPHGYPGVPVDPVAVARAKNAAMKAHREVWRLVTSTQFVLPDDVGNALLRATTAIAEVRNVDDLNGMLKTFGGVLDPYLPTLPKHRPIQHRTVTDAVALVVVALILTFGLVALLGVPS